MSIATISINRPISVMMVVLSIIFLGVLSLFTLPVELMPNISYKKITIMIGMRGGLPPDETEEQVIKPVEDAVGTVNNLESIVSTAEKDRAVVVLRYIPGTNMDYASLEVREAFAKVKNKLPRETEKPVISRYEESDAPILILAVTSIGEKHTPEEMRTLVDRKLKEKLMRVPGVANVDVSGGREVKILANVDKKTIDANKIPLRKIVSKIGVSTMNIRVGSRSEDSLQKGIIFKSEFESIDEIGETSILTSERTGTQFLLKDMAAVKEDYMEAQNLSRYTHFEEEQGKKKKNGGETSNIVSLYIQKESTGNTVNISKGVKEALKKIEAEMSTTYPDLRILKVSDQSEQILAAIREVQEALWEGAVLGFAILLVFFRNLLMSVIVGIAIPISLLGTLIVMKYFDIPFNVMTLQGLTVGMSKMLDDSICVLEHIYSKRHSGMSGREASIEGAQELVLAILAGMLTTVIVFLPIFFLTEQLKMLYQGLAITVIVSVVFSYFVSITVIPILSAKAPIKKTTAEHKINIFKMYYVRFLCFCVRYRRILFAVTVILFVYSMLLGRHLKQELSASGEQDKFTIFVELPDGAKLEVSDKVVAKVEQLLKDDKKYPEVETVTARVEGWSSKVYVNLYPKEKRNRTIKEVIDDLRKTIPTLPEIRKTDGFVYFNEESGQESEEISLDVYGYDYELLAKLANECAAKLEEVPGIVDAKLRMSQGRPEFRIVPNKTKAGELGISTQEIAETLHAEIRGLRAAVFHPKDGSGAEIETVARLDPKYVGSLNDVRNLTLVSPKGHLIFLRDVVEFTEGMSQSEIWRTNKSRMIGVSATSTKLSMDQAIAAAKEKLKTVKFPKEYYYVFSGAYYKMLENKKQLLWALIVTIFLVYMIMAGLFESYFQPFIIMTTVPLGLIGAVFGLLWMKKSVTMGVFLGGIVLIGSVVNSGILVITVIGELRAKGYSLYHSVVTAIIERTRPILMTSLTCIVGMAPMAFDNSSSAEMWSPFALTIMMGMISATAMTLTIVPGMYIMLEQFIGSFSSVFAYIKGPMSFKKFIIYYLVLFNICAVVLWFYFK